MINGRKKSLVAVMMMAALIAATAFGVCHGDMGPDFSNYEETIADYTRRIEKKPIDQEAYYFRGLLYMSVANCQQNASLCANSLPKGHEIDENDAYRKAIADFTKAIELGSGIDAALTHDNLPPNYSPPEIIQRSYTLNSHYFRGMLHAKLKVYQKAIADFSVTTQWDQYADHSMDSFHALGDIYRDLGEDEKAIENYSAVIERSGGFVAATILTERGKLYAKRGEREKALDDAKKACEIKPPRNNCELLEALQSERAGR
jgi:tetratricopeptide (TPR) repeat protein